MTVYLDAVWLLNFLLDMMLLMLTQILAKDSSGKIRIMFGAFVASIIVPISLYYPDSFFTTVLGKICYSLVIILCSFRFYSIRRFLKMLLLFYFTTFSIGGGLIAVHFLLQNPIGFSANGVLTFNKGYGDPTSWIFIVIGFPIIWWFTKNRMDKHATEKIRYDQLYSVTIELNQASHSTTGYIDSGNQLVDPLTKKPVIICDKQFLMNWFSEDEWELLKNAQEELDFDCIPDQWQNRIQLVPFQGVDGKRLFMLTIKPDNITVYYDKGKIITSKALIGIQFASLTDDDSYHCLLHPQIIKLAAVHPA